MFVLSSTYTSALKAQNDNIELMQELIAAQDERIQLLDEKIEYLEGLRARKESDEPWVELLGGDVDPDKGLEMKLDWNDAFVEQLRAQGYKGTTESSLIAQWLLNVSNGVKPQEGDA